MERPKRISKLLLWHFLWHVDIYIKVGIQHQTDPRYWFFGDQECGIRDITWVNGHHASFNISSNKSTRHQFWLKAWVTPTAISTILCCDKHDFLSKCRLPCCIQQRHRRPSLGINGSTQTASCKKEKIHICCYKLQVCFNILNCACDSCA